MKYTIGIAVTILAAVVIIFGLRHKENGDFLETYKSTPNAVLVDVRTPEEYKAGHIAGAINVDIYNPAFLDEIRALGADKKFFIYCRSGSRSGNAKALMRQAGLEVTDLSGGVAAHPELVK